MSDAFMLDLFRVEAESHAATLEKGLADGPPVAGGLEELVRAAHSLRGAARIVGLDPAVELARAMEEVLDRAAEGEQDLTPPMAETLAGAAGVFARLAESEAGEIPDRAEGMAGEMEELARALDSGEGVAASEPALEPEPEPEPEPTPDPEAQPAPAPESGREEEPFRLDADPSMLSLFLEEAATSAQVLNNGLVELEESGASGEGIEPLMRAAHSIKGAARIVNIPPAVELAHAMEDVLVEAQEGRTALDQKAVDHLLSGVDLFLDISRSTPEDLGGALGKLVPRMVDVRDRLQGREPEAPAAPAKPVQPEPKTAPKPLPEEEPAPEKAPKPKPGQPARSEPDQAKPVSRSSDASLRVSARNLDRIMALAGEYIIEAARTRELGQGLKEVKGALGEGFRLLAELREEAWRCRQAVEAAESEEPGAVRVQGHLPGQGGFQGVAERFDRAAQALASHMDRFETYARRTENLSERLYNAVVESRMRPFSDGTAGFSRLVRDVARDLGKKARLTIRGKETRVDRDILERLEAPLNHLLRNAVDHGIETPEVRAAAGKEEAARVVLEARHSAGLLNITVRDDGRGLDPESIRTKVAERGLAPADMAEKLTEAELMDFLFLPGFSTAGQVTEISGRGVGLDVVHNMVQEVGGTVRAETSPGRGCAFILQLPITLSVIRTLLVQVAGEPYAIPLTRIDRVFMAGPEEIRTVQDRRYIDFDQTSAGLVSAAEVLELPRPEEDPEGVSVVVVSDRYNRYGLIVDRFLGEEDLVVRPLDPRLGKVPDIYASARLPEGSPVLILDVEDVVRSVDNLLAGGRLKSAARGRGPGRKEAGAVRVLVVDDSLTVREVQRKLLESAGYEVETAVDGMDGLNAAQAGDYDLVISDVDMPRMNGIDLVKRLKADPRLRDTPVMIVSYKDREQDRLKGLEAGADYYLTKSSFQDETLLSAVADLVGEAL